MLQTAIGLSIIFGFISSEFLNILSGGLVSAGYLAFFIEQPYRILSTSLLSILTCLIVKLLQKFTIIYGRRRFMITVLISLCTSYFINRSFFYMADVNQDLRIIGYIIPGLIANDMLKQGIFKTLVMVYLSAILIRLIIMIGVYV
jgi:poly-gamma-glutamate biosynthesis protein PgsC/CapC